MSLLYLLIFLLNHILTKPVTYIDHNTISLNSNNFIANINYTIYDNDSEDVQTLRTTTQNILDTLNRYINLDDRNINFDLKLVDYIKNDKEINTIINYEKNLMNNKTYYFTYSLIKINNLKSDKVYKKNSKDFKASINELQPDSASEVFDGLVQEIIKSPELQKSKEVSNHYLQKAENLIDTLNNESGKKMLLEIIVKIRDRNH